MSQSKLCLPGERGTIPTSHRVSALRIAEQAEMEAGSSHQKWTTAAFLVNHQHGTNYTPDRLKRSVASLVV